MDIVVWLRSLGLEKYEPVFRDNKINDRVLPNLTQEDLKELGVASLWHRRKLLDAIGSRPVPGLRVGGRARQIRREASAGQAD